MFTELFRQFLTFFVSERIAVMLSEPMAVFSILILILGIFSIFIKSASRKVFFIGISIVTIILIVFFTANYFGAVVFPFGLVK